MKRWKVAKHYGIWYAIENGWKRYESFPTWDKAMEYADRETSPTPVTVTIKDPSGKVCDLTATIKSRNHICLKAGDDTFNLMPHEWKPLAGFLLDVAKYKEEA